MPPDRGASLLRVRSTVLTPTEHLRKLAPETMKTRPAADNATIAD